MADYTTQVLAIEKDGSGIYTDGQGGYQFRSNGRAICEINSGGIHLKVNQSVFFDTLWGQYGGSAGPADLAFTNAGSYMEVRDSFGGTHLYWDPYGSKFGIPTFIQFFMGGSVSTPGVTFNHRTDDFRVNVRAQGGASTRGVIVIGTQAQGGTSFGHPAKTYPSLFLHSATLATTTTSEHIGLFHDGTDGYVQVGKGSLRIGVAPLQGTETTSVAVPAANGYKIYAEDNGAGKTRLMVQFATGAAQQLAIEP